MRSDGSSVVPTEEIEKELKSVGDSRELPIKDIIVVYSVNGWYVSKEYAKIGGNESLVFKNKIET